MRKPLSRPERDDCGTFQTSLRRHPPGRSARRGYTVAPIPYRGDALRHVGPRDATWVPLPISTGTASSPLGPWAPDRGAGGNSPICCNTIINLYEQIFRLDRAGVPGAARSAPARRHDAGDIPTGCPSNGPPDL